MEDKNSIKCIHEWEDKKWIEEEEFYCKWRDKQMETLELQEQEQ